MVNAVYGAPARLAALAEDLVAHWEERRERMSTFMEAPGKALIVGGTREICANLYSAIITLRPDWHSPDLDKGRIKVVYSGTPSDVPPVSEHVRRDSANATIKARLKDVDDELEIVIVKDMMLTGYDSPPLHTLYLDRPLKGALLMQTLARVNRTFRGKADGLLVAYAPLADNLQKALAEYTQSDQEHRPVGRNIELVVALTTELVAAIRTLLAGHDWRAVMPAGGPRGFIKAATSATNYLRDPKTLGNQVTGEQESLAARYRLLSGQLARAWALCSKSDAVQGLRPEITFYEEVRVWMAKFDAEDRQSRNEPIPEEIQRLLGRLIATSTASGEIVDIYEAAGMPKPSLSDLNPDFVAKTQHADNPHLAIEALRKLLTEESARATGSNVVRQRAFSERIAELMGGFCLSTQHERGFSRSPKGNVGVLAELVSTRRRAGRERRVARLGLARS